MGRALAIAAAAALAAAVLLNLLAPPPTAAPGLGTDEAFALGRHRREVTRDGALRWTRRVDAFRFVSLPRGTATVEVHVPDNRVPVAVAVNGQPAGTIGAGAGHLAHDVPVEGGALTVTLHALETGGPPFGARLGSVGVRHAPARLPSAWLVLSFLVAAVVTAAGARWASLTPGLAGAFGAAACLALGGLLFPHGLLRAPWAITAGGLLAAGAVLAAIVARAGERRRPGAGAWAFGAVLVAVLVQLVFATSPVMVVSDVVFHANKLRQVAAGDLFPVSVTQHATPFRFPYGVAFYALLAPLARAGLDPVRTVQYGAAVSGVAASVALFLLLLPRRGAPVAAAAVTLLNLLPITFDVYSYGNLSNVFGQSLTVIFFAWWAGSARGGWPVGLALGALASLSHFSSFVVLGVLGLALAVARYRAGTLDRTRVVGLAAGLGVAAAYYLSFAPLVLEQLPRLREGGGTGKEPRGLVREAWDELLWLRIRWGIPAILLGLAGRPRPARGPLDLDLAAYWLAGLVMAVLAVTTPVEVRYVYALTLPLAVAAAEGALGLRERGRIGLLAAALLLLSQVVVGGQAILEAVFTRYR